MKLSVCIPSRAQVLGLWATICSCGNAMGDIEHEFIIVINGRPRIDDSETFLLHQWRDSCVRIIHKEEVLSPTEARDLAAQHASGDFIVFFDDHCIPQNDWFRRVIFNDRDILHSSLSAAPGRPRVFHFTPSPNKLITGTYAQHPLYSKTYRCLSAQAAGFAVKNSVWKSIGGYGEHFDGYGGEEAFLNIKAQMLGYEVWLDPEMTFYHYFTTSGIRGYERIENRFNWFGSAYVLGGQEWANKEMGSSYCVTPRVEKAREEFRPRITKSIPEVFGALPSYHD